MQPGEGLLRPFQLVSAFLGAACALPSASGAQTAISFLTVSLEDEGTQAADDALQQYLQIALESAGHPVDFNSRSYDYEQVIDELLNWDVSVQGPFIARTTPYVYVVSRMLGGRFAVLATYVSRTTGRRTYHSYFVVNRRHPQFSETPDLDELNRYLASQDPPATFVFHDKFSTSSYFLPSLYFKRQGIYQATVGGLTTIGAQSLDGGGSTTAARMVARDPSKFAAVWDGTKAKFEPGGSEYGRHGSDVAFIQLPTALPNDLLVVSGLGPDLVEVITRALSEMRGDSSNHIGLGDYDWWEPIRTAPDAREALATLNQLAATTPPFVTIRVLSDTMDRVPDSYLDAARQAVRFSGSEFVVFDGDFHEHDDYVWKFTAIHDGAVMLESRINDFPDLDPQIFRLSFENENDLTKRLTALIHSRVHRIRYVWPYLPDQPTVVRDVDFSIEVGSQLNARRITWRDPATNDFQFGESLTLEVVAANYHRFEFAPQAIPAGVLNPLSNVAYRVVLERNLSESKLLRFLTYVFVLLLILASVGAVIDVRRAAA